MKHRIHKNSRSTNMPVTELTTTRFSATGIALAFLLVAAPLTSALGVTRSLDASENPTPKVSNTESAPTPESALTPDDSAQVPELQTEKQKPQRLSARAGEDIRFNVNLNTDGTPGWDQEDGTGNDTGPKNGVVRVNDIVTYKVSYGVTSSAADNVTFSLTFPKGMEITEIPGFCLAGTSSITPQTAGNLTLPLTANSVNELEEQTLVCNTGRVESGVEVADISVKVLNLVHNGADLQIKDASLKADNRDSVPSETPLPSVKASARLMWDVSKNSIDLDEDRGYAHLPSTIQCPWDEDLKC